MGAKDLERRKLLRKLLHRAREIDIFNEKVFHESMSIERKQLWFPFSLSRGKFHRVEKTSISLLDGTDPVVSQLLH